MSIAYLNGQLLPIEEAKVPALDRGFLFGDGVYEVIPVYAGRLFRFKQHIARLENSLQGIRLPMEQTLQDWANICHQLIEQNSLNNASIYLQITRGAYPERNHDFPANPSPTIFAMITALPEVQAVPSDRDLQGISVITAEDIRWQRCDIKAITLLANCMLKQQALECGANDTILVRGGVAFEATSSNLFIVRDGVIITPPLSEHLLPGITRDFLLWLAEQHGILTEQRLIPEHELLQADEIWLTSSTKEIRPVTRLNDVTIGNGTAGPVWRQMYDHYQQLKVQLYRGEIDSNTEGEIAL
ncbi:D-amino acid aminotransferase [Kangiella profundi]|uniref:Aminodeoxychorismate lyase n=1 Tax=Kangiella profundi TaxID=1561924 RepID=A0A2K9AC64_9GAMM|nr:D-amino acid aminotransferase [Kangiella profundi]AUD77966.1 D-amino acid aminotransferase [Kangiella profundi]GGE91074.1 D-amino acid aminotransferase [Kangiella profundi]